MNDAVKSKLRRVTEQMKDLEIVAEVRLVWRNGSDGKIMHAFGVEMRGSIALDTLKLCKAPDDTINAASVELAQGAFTAFVRGKSEEIVGASEKMLDSIRGGLVDVVDNSELVIEKSDPEPSITLH